MIRLILIVIFAIIIIFASLIMLPVFWLIGKFNQDAKDRGSLRFVQGVFKVVLFLSGVTTTVKGLENLPKDGESDTSLLCVTTITHLFLSLANVFNILIISPAVTLSRLPVGHHWYRLNYM